MASVADTEPAGAGHQRQRRAHLERGLRFADTIVMAVAGTGPAYSISATTVFIVATIGLASPAALLWCGLPMLGIAIAYYQLNKMGDDAGAAYAWVGRALHPGLGFLAGWCLVVAATIFMVAGSLPAGQATIALFSEHASAQAGWYTAAGVIWFLVISYFVARGIRITAKAQWIMSSIEIGLLVVFLVLAFAHTPKVHSFSFSWLTFSHFGSAGTFASGALIAAFYYWGWDVSANLSEETEEADGHTSSAGLGGVIGVVIALVIFELFTIIINMSFTQSHIANSANPLEDLGQLVGGSFGAKLMIIAIMLSTIAGLETTLVQVTRSLFSMARQRTLPARLGGLHPDWNTPVFATAVIAVISLILFIVSNFAGGIQKILADAESAIDLQICVYYGLAGIAAVVVFHRYVFRSVKNFFLMGLFPLSGGVFMLYIFVEALATGTIAGVAVWLGIGGLVIGIVPVLYYKRKGSPFLEQKPTLGRVDVAGVGADE